ncbi:DUF5133 domain-containing protein [Streptomyces tsukubensis]|uniref:DUF5133 domain-containing protein n=1 Tax=Streptomyces tsukubensis TaxID=83656 RepID=A0A1V4AG84_9ACTN|nr:DUF5133 domain-containing protein [Streptomyces tsukubensis]OON82770.1 hypothetical protein B1H18_01660 [Streptomyces tsukubensis]QFR92054.1 DUF5133 domain-containing protein [Streptomyces tsukubensis]
MITPQPQILRALLARYADARIMQFENDTAANRSVLDDIAYTLCVTTGTCGIEEALATADDFLAGQQRAARAPRLSAPDTTPVSPTLAA